MKIKVVKKIDVGSVLLPVTTEDLESLDSVLSAGGFEKPTLKLSIYKNRRGRYKGVYLWCKSNLGTCRVDPMFCTSYTYELIPIEDTVIKVDETSAF